MIDEATVEARAGNGGNGLVTFLREALRPLGGPAGGNGGNGGSVTLVADASLNTLLKFRWRRHFIAKNGGNGARNKRHGANGESVDVTVPVGTEVWRIGDRAGEPEIFLGDLVHPGQRLEVAKGGRGGLGNAAFVTAVNREPLLAEAGEAGETVKLRLNLKILADVGLVGMPNAGKSSLLTAISAARPKIADYPFTTLEPVLGIVEHGIDAFAAVDIPGLIEGASDGIGLGHEFLKHMQRTRLLVHVVDGSEGEPGERIRAINQELDAFDPKLAQTPQIVAVNKLDLEEVELLRNEIEEEVREAVGEDTPVHFISAATRRGIDDLVAAISYRLADIRKQDTVANEATQVPYFQDGRDPLDDDNLPVFQPRMADTRMVVRTAADSYRIVYDRAVRLALGSNLDNWDALVQYHQRLERMNVTTALRRAGAKNGDVILVGEWEFEWQ
ncbi:MAG: GTPase ObgE [Chloroflexi bacterium]|nr:GTPase ObgE [Chloroflexota bacterium]